MLEKAPTVRPVWDGIGDSLSVFNQCSFSDGSCKSIASCCVVCISLRMWQAMQVRLVRLGQISYPGLPFDDSVDDPDGSIKMYGPATLLYP